MQRVMINFPTCVLEVSNWNLDMDIDNAEIFFILLSVCRKTTGYRLEISWQSFFFRNSKHSPIPVLHYVGNPGS